MHWLTAMLPLMLLLLATQHMHCSSVWQQSDNGIIDEDLIEVEDKGSHSLSSNTTKNEEELNDDVFMMNADSDDRGKVNKNEFILINLEIHHGIKHIFCQNFKLQRIISNIYRNFAT